ncbi:MAG: VWA domain-containing protein [Blastocatellia bacterium]|nr:VWA domain-containing protein [Blastocatellia bacterium]
MKLIHLLLAIFLSLSFLTTSSFAQQKPPSSSTEKQEKIEDDDDPQEMLLEFKTQLVLVPFSAVDRSNRPINDLKIEELKLYENGQPAQILSLQRTGNTTINFALLVDLSGSMQPYIDQVQSAADRFFNQALKPDKDSAAVIAFQKEIVVTQPLTTEKLALTKSLNSKSLLLPSAGSLAPVIDGETQRATGTALYGAVYIAVDEILKSAQGRRVILLLTDGYDSESGIELRDAIDYAWRREVTIYAIGIGDIAGINREVMDKLCSVTGGQAFYPKTANELDQVFAQIDQDLRDQYILSFSPNSEGQETFRTVKIEIPNRPLIKLFHRFGYYSSSSSD